MKAALHCHNCGTRAEVELNEQQSASIRNQGYINRACRECVGITRWEMQAAPESAPPPSSLPFAGCRGRILVIDDDIDVLTVLSKGLAKHKFDVVVADSAREALTMLARGDFDVVVSDIHMPQFDGRQLMQFLDEHLPDYKERVVFISGDTGTPETMAFVAQQQRPFVPKPLDMPALLEAIRPYLRESAGFVPYEEAVVVAAVEPPAAERKPPSSEMTSEEKSATEEALSYAVITLRGEVKTLKRTLDERNAEVEALRRELAGREADGRKRFDEMYQEQERLRAEAAQKAQEAQEAAAARAELEKATLELEQLRSQVERLKPDTSAAEREKEFARREAELQKELKEAAQATQRLEKEAATLRQETAKNAQRLEKEAAALRQETAALRQQAVTAEAQAATAKREAEAVVPQREQAEADVERWRKAAEEAEAEAERARRDLAVAYGRHETETTELRHKAIEAQSEMGKQMGELQQAQAVVAKAQEELKQTREAMQQAGAELQRAQETMKEKEAALNPEEKRRLAQLEAVRERLEHGESKALKLEAMLREFYLRIVNPLTVAVATTDLVSSSQWLSPRDRETLQLLEQNLDHLLDAVKVLKKQMKELGIEFG